MIIGIGVDALEIRKLKGILGSRQKEFLGAVFTEKEISYAKSKEWPVHLATAFVAKEAVFKCLDLSATEAKNVGLRHIEILRETSGKPKVHLLGTLSKRFPAKRYRFLLSMSFTRTFAVASAVLEQA